MRESTQSKKINSPNNPLEIDYEDIQPVESGEAVLIVRLGGLIVYKKVGEK